jgi:Contractile injection system tube protein/LysM domain
MEQPEQAMIGVNWQDGPFEWIPVQFNPTEFSLDKSVQIAEIAIPGLDSPLLQFVRGQNEKMTLDLFFDTTEDGMSRGATSVTTRTDRIYELAKIEPGRHAPPLCTFYWNSKFPGSDTSSNIGNQRRNFFDFIVESVRQKFTLFSSEGIPLRATLTLTLREYKTLDTQLAELNLQSPDRTQSHITQSDDTLSSIAARHYQKPGEWRRIADENNIEDPRRMVPGTFLTVPPIP